MKTLLLILLQCYTALFPKETQEAVDFFTQHSQEISTQLKRLDKETRKIAIAIVAPEVSQYSTVMDFFELRTLFISYRNFGRGDFSVGYFQMKPSFIEGLESEIAKSSALTKKYSSYLPRGTDKEKRETRLKRLRTLEWQLKYLEVFIDVAKQKTKGIKFPDNESKLRYWATLYNSGFSLSKERVKHYQNKKLFPRSSRSFNYSDVAVEFYKLLGGST